MAAQMLSEILQFSRYGHLAVPFSYKCLKIPPLIDTCAICKNQVHTCVLMSELFLYQLYSASRNQPLPHTQTCPLHILYMETGQIYYIQSHFFGLLVSEFECNCILLKIIINIISSELKQLQTTWHFEIEWQHLFVPQKHLLQTQVSAVLLCSVAKTVNIPLI